MNRSLAFLAAVILAASTSVARAADAVPPPPLGIPDLTGPRTLALEATIGAAASNDGIFVNAAALAARRRYSVEGMYLFDRRGAETPAKYFGASVVDAISSPVTAGLAYTRATGAYTGNLFHLALAGPVVDKLYVGVTGKYVTAHGAKSVSAATADASIFWQVVDLLSIGAAGYNLVPISNPDVAPRGFGAGLAIGTDTLAQVTFDWRTDLDRGPKSTNRYALGGEVLLGSLVPVRAGWMKDETLATQWWSLGAGLVTRGGVSLDVGYRQSIETPSARTVAFSLKGAFVD